MGFEVLKKAPPTVVLGENSQADQGVLFMLTNGQRGNLYDLIRFCDTFLLYDVYYAEKLQKYDFHYLRQLFLDRFPSFREFVKDIEYSKQENEERWSFAVQEALKRSPSKIAIRRIQDEYKYTHEQFGRDLFKYAKAEVPKGVFQQIISKYNLQRDSIEYLLTPQLIRAYLNLYPAGLCHIGHCFQTLRQLLTDLTIKNNEEDYENLADLRDEITKYIFRVRNLYSQLKPFGHPSTMAFQKAKRWSDLPIILEELRFGEFKQMRNIMNAVPKQGETKITEMNEILRNMIKDNRKIGWTGWLRRNWAVPVFVATQIGAVVLSQNQTVPGAALVGIGLMPQLYKHIRREMKERHYGLTVFRKVRSEAQEVQNMHGVINQLKDWDISQTVSEQARIGHPQ